MSESIAIRPALRADLPAIVQMRNALNQLELAGCPHAAILRLSEEQFAAHWGPTFDSPEHCWRIVEAAGKPVGFGLLYLVPKPPPAGAFIQWAYVDPAHRRHGAGQQLLEQLTAWARGNGARRIELQFVEGNEIAARFWTKMGFRPYARKCVYYFETEGAS